MPATFKPSGPSGVVRPFVPQMNEDDSGERVARALEHIATALSAIDHNLENILARMPKSNP